MAASSKNLPKSRPKQIRIARKRYLKRLERRGKHYGHSLRRIGGAEIKNPSFKLRNKPKGFKNVVLPEMLSQAGPENIEPLIEVCAVIRHHALNEPVKRLVVDFEPVSRVEPSAALMLLAEIKRCIAYSSNRTYITGTYPKNDGVAQILTDLGFFEALGVKEPRIDLSEADKTFVRVTQHRQTDAELIDRMLSLFSKEIGFSGEERKTLHKAFLECMDNVRQHAYIWESKAPHLYKEWWMAGFIDHVMKQATFLFYDQGLGIPYTIKRRKHRRVLDRVQHWSDADWIARALRRRESRHASQRRGHGLKRLRLFNKVSARDVELRIISNTGCYLLDTQRKEHKSAMKYSLNGTLIEWSLSEAPVPGGSK